MWVCVCVCACVHTHPYIWGRCKHFAKGAFLSKTNQGIRQLNLQKRNNSQWVKGAGGPNTFIQNKGRTDRYTEAQGRKQITGRAGLGWACGEGVKGGGRLTEAPRGLYLDNDYSNSEGKGPGAGITIVTASSKHQKTVAPDRSNVSFLQLRKMVADSERSDLITWHLTERETISLGKRFLWSLGTLHQRFPIRPNPPILQSAHGGDKEDVDICMCDIDT